MNIANLLAQNSLTTKTLQSKKLFTMLALASLSLSSCSKEQDTATVSLAAQSSVENSTSSTGYTAGGVAITDFSLNIKEIEFEYDEKDAKAAEGSFKDIKLKGPYELNLLEQGKTLHESIGVTTLPNAAYDEVEFKIHKGKELPESNPLYNKSILVKGTINSTPFIMWHDVEEEFEVSYADDREFIAKSNKLHLTIDFQIERILNAVNSIDLTQAKDGNNDGIVEISPYDKDGNNALAKLLKDNIREAADLKN